MIINPKQARTNKSNKSLIWQRICVFMMSVMICVTMTPAAFATEVTESPQNGFSAEITGDDTVTDIKSETDNGEYDGSSYYTVDFYYTSDNGAFGEYHMDGGSEMMLSDIFDEIGVHSKTLWDGMLRT